MVMSLALDAITVCVDYSEYLALTVSNRAAFDRWMIVTVERDTDTIALCEREGLDYCFSDRLYEGGPFCRGKAINDGILQLDPRPSDWLVHLDADTYLFAETFRNMVEETDLDPDNLYGLWGRYLVQNEDELKATLERTVIQTSELEHVKMLVGYFQMWHTSMREFYPEQSTHAGLDDILMRDGFTPNRWKFFPSYAIHIGPLWTNHKGVVT
jgi:hypothetical protein